MTIATTTITTLDAPANQEADTRADTVDQPQSYRVDLVEQLEDEFGNPLGAALLSDADFQTDNLVSAKAFVDQFNGQELDENAGLWAIARPVTESDELPSNLLPASDEEFCDHLVVLVKPLCDSQGRTIRFASLEVKWQVSEKTARRMAKRWNKKEREAAATPQGGTGQYAIVIPAPTIPSSE